VSVDTETPSEGEFLNDQEVFYLMDAARPFVEEARRLNMTKSAMVAFLEEAIDEIMGE
jgi:hypothetical protein